MCRGYLTRIVPGAGQTGDPVALHGANFGIADVLGALTTRTITYTYDLLNRLTGAEYSTGKQFEYTYNAVGNRTCYTETLAM